MSLSKTQVRHIAKLARLHIKEEELDNYQKQLSSILDYVETLQSLDTSDVKELQHAADVANVLRDDEVQSCESSVRDRSIENFSQKEGDLLAVQAVFENRTE